MRSERDCGHSSVTCKVYSTSVHYLRTDREWLVGKGCQERWGVAEGVS